MIGNFYVETIGTRFYVIDGLTGGIVASKRGYQYLTQAQRQAVNCKFHDTRTDNTCRVWL